jgi:hypothetical protein
VDKVIRSLKKIRLGLTNNKDDKVNFEIKIIKIKCYTLFVTTIICIVATVHIHQEIEKQLI